MDITDRKIFWGMTLFGILGLVTIGSLLKSESNLEEGLVCERVMDQETEGRSYVEFNGSKYTCKVDGVPFQEAVKYQNLK